MARPPNKFIIMPMFLFHCGRGFGWGPSSLSHLDPVSDTFGHHDDGGIREVIQVWVIWTCFQQEYRAFFVLRETCGEDVASGSGPDDHDVVTHGVSFVR